MTRLIRREYRESWAEHAALEAIDVELRRAERLLAEASAYLAWVQGVRTRRVHEIAAGEWPTRPSGGASE